MVRSTGWESVLLPPGILLFAHRMADSRLGISSSSPWYPSVLVTLRTVLAGNQFFFPLVSFPLEDGRLQVGWESVLLPPGILL